MNKPIILHLTSLLDGGAGQYTMNIHQNMIADGYESYVCYKGEQLITPSGEVLSITHKKSSFISRLKRYVLRKIISWTGGIDMKYAPYNLFEHIDFYDPDELLKVLPKKPTHIMVHWVSGYANAKYVRKLHERTGANVFYWMIDEAVLSGGCHFPWDCEGYKSGCKDCPMTKSRIIKHEIRKNFQFKQRYIIPDMEMVLPTEMDRLRLEQSQLWEGHAWHKLIEIVNEEVFYPATDRAPLLKKYNLPTDKRIILFGSFNLAEERKGMRVLLEALRMINRSDVVCVVIGSNDELDISLPTIRLGMVDIPTLADLYRVADVFVCPSLEDSGPQMINQSIMSGTPVVAFEMGVALDIVKTGETGYLAKWNDAADYAGGINVMLNTSSKELSRIRANCRRVALRTYSRDELAGFINSLDISENTHSKEQKTSVLRTLSVCTSDSSGGAARAAYRIHQGVRALGVNSHMFVKNKGSQDPNVHALSEFVPNNSVYNALDWCAAKVKNQIQHYRWNKYPNKDASFKSDLRGTRIHGAFSSWDYDILHLHWINLRFIKIDDLLKVRKPIVWTLHDTWPFCGVCHYFGDCEGYHHQCGACPRLGSNDPHDLSHQIWSHKAEIYKHLDLHIVTPSRWLANCVKQSTLLGKFPVTVIPNGLDMNVFHIIQEFGKQSSSPKPIILYGAVNAVKDKNKGFRNLLIALRILDSQGFKAQLVVFGAEAQELPMNFKNIDVHFVGYIRDTGSLVSLYNEADVMVVPSFNEVFGQTASEAMACGTPVVAFRCTGIQDVVEDGCGYLAEPYSTEDLANGIRYCIENNPDNVLGKAARESAVRRYAIDVVAKQYAELYRCL